MHIQQIDIYGFGKWVEASFTIEEPFFVLYGRNESGKSTLRRFILFILFGLPPKARAFYQPKTSSRMGGRLTIKDPKIGVYTIERFDGKNQGQATCYLPCGTTKGEDWLQKQLKGLTEHTYRAIYSFSALDLVSFHDQKNEDLGEILLNISLTGSQHLYQFEKKLKQKLDQLFKPRGKVPLINQQLEKCDALFASLSKHKAEEEQYQKMLTQKKKLEEDLERLAKTYKQLLKEQMEIQQLRNALPLIKEYYYYETELVKLPKHIPFPKQGQERLQSLKKQLLPLESEQRVLEQNKKKYIAHIKEAKAKLYVEDDLLRMKQLLEDDPSYAKDRKTCHALEQSLNEKQVKINELLNYLQIDLQPEEFTKQVLPFHLEKTWKTLERDLQQLHLEEEQLEQEQQDLKEAQQLVQLERKSLQEDVKKLEDHPSKFDQSSQLFLKKNRSFLFQGMILLSLVLGALALMVDPAFLYGLIPVLLLIGYFEWQSRKFSQRNESYEDPSTSHLAHRFHTLDEQKRTLQVKQMQWEEKKTAFKERKRRLKALIQRERELYPFLENIDAIYWSELYHQLSRLQSLQEEFQKIQQNLIQMKRQLTAFETKVKTLYKALFSKKPPTSIKQQIEQIKQQLQEQEHYTHVQQQYEQLLEEVNERKAQLIAQKQPYEQEIKELFKIAKVADEEAFYERGQLFQRQQEKLSRLEQLEKQLSQMIPKMKKNLKDLAKKDEQSLKIQEEEIKQSIVEISEQQEEKRQQLAELKASIRQIESSGQYSKRLHQFSLAKEHLQELVKEWAVYEMAAQLLQDTKANYITKHLEAVLERTTTYFHKITDGSYRQVYLHPQKDQLYVEHQASLYFSVQELSQGTIDQLYIALRLAMSDLMSERYNVPLIIDDAFIHSDALRTKRIVALLKDISKKQQVLLFTCNEHLWNSFASEEVQSLNEPIRIKQ